MKWLHVIAVVGVVAFSLAGCGERAREQTYQEQLYVFGTLADITLRDVEPEQGRRAMATIAEDFQRMHREWHAWEPGPLSELNQAIAEGRTITVPPSIVPLLEQSQRIYELSEGLFNPAIGRLLSLWGFQSSERPNGPPPARDAVARLVAADPSMDDLLLEDGELRSQNAMVQLDFGGIAKGYAVDLALARLKTLGVTHALVNAGGGLGVIGRHGDRPWRVGIRHPQGQGVLGSVVLHDGESVHTSGNYERFRQHEGVRYAHILDPRTGWPVEGITSASVIHHDGTLADAAATVLVIAGPGEWHRLARRMGIRHAMLVDEAGTVYMSPSMVERVEFTTKPARIVVSDPL